MPYRALVITCSDRAHAGVYADRSGPTIVDGLRAAGFDASAPTVVPDDIDAIVGAIRQAVRGGARAVVTCGGTGVGPRDVTVEATRGLLDYELPGIAEVLRRVGPQPHAMLSRGLAGIVTCDGVRAVVVNAPGSVGGARDTVEHIVPALQHLIDQLDGGDHG
ncbi:molybdenum cofactor biosynthesis protein B [uncultured Tessaracoccus sp.]|uniref:MogA/MoaB family molybdenum cofactor biosynthesis protein n=1 Tax=uncultured Tessaracoccus sp. TaxID=905023 RepID=UPI0026233A73|nr:MogA/MoaB family molybdenum cofactor biosynthesis protein [uncultured Tessaracoccus sp.]